MASNTPTGLGRRELTVDEYFAGVRAGEVSTLARALTLVESHHSRHQQLAEELLTRLMPYTGGALRLGITGVPGVGKSTFIEALGMHLVDNQKRVAVLAVDPSSDISGGSILGDKTRMPELSVSPNAYIRPAPSAGTLGGVASRTRESMLICEAAGYDVVLVETVGVGQSETMVADMTDCFLALMLPGAGDELQGIKRGLLEYVDVIAINKADGSNQKAAERAAHQYEMAFKSLSTPSSADSAPAILTCSALQREGIAAVWKTIQQRYQTQQSSGSLQQLRGRQNLRWMWSLVDQQLKEAVQKNAKVRALREELEQAVQNGSLPTEAAARQIINALGINHQNEAEQ